MIIKTRPQDVLLCIDMLDRINVKFDLPICTPSEPCINGIKYDFVYITINLNIFSIKSVAACILIKYLFPQNTPIRIPTKDNK